MSFHNYDTNPSNVIQEKNDKPFFNKEDDGNQDKEAASGVLNETVGEMQKPFFSPPVLQAKCSTCADEEKIQQKSAFESDEESAEILQFSLGDMFDGGLFGSGQSEESDQATPDKPKSSDETATNVAKYIVEDHMTPGPGQMNKSAFLEQMHGAVCATADSALSGTPFTSNACPYISKIFAKQKSSSSASIERLVHRYAPSTKSASSANELIQGVQGSVRQAVRTWVSTKSLAHLPAGIMNLIPSSLKLLSGVASAIGDLAQAAVSGVNSVLTGLKQLFFKPQNGGSRRSHSPEAVQHKLGKGQSLDSGTRSQMENAFGANFSGVEVHQDATAATLSADMNAKAFTVGNQVAFGSGEYRPGTPEGDALIAHELAHVQQQGNGKTKTQTKSLDKATYNSLEHEADQAAYQAVSGIWGLDLGLGEQKQKSKVAAKSGLQINRCSCVPSKDRDEEKEKEKPKDVLTDEQKEEIKRRKLENIPPTSAKLSVAEQAKKFQTQEMKKESFMKFTSGEWGFFFSPNNGLNGTASKPSKFDSYDDFDGFTSKQKTVVITLTDGAVDERKISKKKSTVDKLKAAYAKWPDGDYAVFQGVPPGSAEATYTCNILVGDSLYASGNDIINKGKYYSAKKTFAGGINEMYNIDKVHAQPGDIIAYRGIHLGVIVSVNLDTDSICALEGTSAGGIAGPRCREKTDYDRTVLGTGSKVYRIK